MGLSVKWASLNAGARSPEDYGGYYAWGETEPKQIYTYDTYKYADMTGPDGFTMSLAKYNTIANWGPVDYRIILEEEDDVASVLYGEGWRTPTRTEMNELLTRCTSTWTTLNGVEGYEIKSGNGNSIFFPAAGYKVGEGTEFSGSIVLYWGSELFQHEHGGCIYLTSSTVYMGGSAGRYMGFPVRPVKD